MIKIKNIQYRLPLILITKYKWAELNKPARAILPVIGVFISKNGETYAGLVKTIMKYSGYSDYHSIKDGIKSLIKSGIIAKEKKGKGYLLRLTDVARWKRGRSYFPVDKKEMILSQKWANLKPVEKSLYIVLGVKASVNHTDIPDNYHGTGLARPIKKYCLYAGICRQSFYDAYQGLINNDLVIGKEYEDDDQFLYAIKCLGITVKQTIRPMTSYRLYLDYEDGELYGDVEDFIYDMESRYDFDVNKEVKNITNWLIKNRISRGKITDLPGFIIHCLNRHNESKRYSNYDKNNYGDQITNMLLEKWEKNWEK